MTGTSRPAGKPNLYRCKPWLVQVLRAKKIEKLALFVSQHLTNHFALAIRDVAISEKLLVQRNIFLMDKYIERNHSAPHCLNIRPLYP